MPAPYIGLGMLNTVGDSIALVVNSTPPGRERELVDVTSLDGTLQFYRPGIEKFREYTFDVLYEEGHEGLISAFESKAEQSCSISFTETAGYSLSFTAFVSKIEYMQVEHNRPLMLRVTLQVVPDPE